MTKSGFPLSIQFPTATALSLRDVAARLIFGIEPGRFAWANARRVADDHALEVESLAAEAGRAVVAKLEGRVV
jgi:hypothetical protein